MDVFKPAIPTRVVEKITDGLADTQALSNWALRGRFLFDVQASVSGRERLFSLVNLCEIGLICWAARNGQPLALPKQMLRRRLRGLEWVPRGRIAWEGEWESAAVRSGQLPEFTDHVSPERIFWVVAPAHLAEDNVRLSGLLAGPFSELSAMVARCDDVGARGVLVLNVSGIVRDLHARLANAGFELPEAVTGGSAE
ncbi:MAG: hypothetical protein OHK0024_24060 [Thalassobaculales bacterium]